MSLLFFVCVDLTCPSHAMRTRQCPAITSSLSDVNKASSHTPASLSTRALLSLAYTLVPSACTLITRHMRHIGTWRKAFRIRVSRRHISLCSVSGRFMTPTALPSSLPSVSPPPLVSDLCDGLDCLFLADGVGAHVEHRTGVPLGLHPSQLTQRRETLLLRREGILHTHKA